MEAALRLCDGLANPVMVLPDKTPSGGAALAALGFQFAAAIVLAVLAGQWIDKRFATAPWGILGGAAVGLGAGMYVMARALGGKKP